MPTVAMLIADLDRLAGTVEGAADDVLGHARSLTGATLPSTAFGAAQDAWREYETGRSALAASLHDVHGRASGSAGTVRTAIDAQVANDAAAGGAITATGQR